MTACRCKNLQAVFIKRKKKQKRKTFPLRSEESHASHNFTLFFSLRVNESIRFYSLTYSVTTHCSWSNLRKFNQTSLKIEKQWLKTDKRKQINSHTSNFHTTITPLQKYPLAKGRLRLGIIHIHKKQTGVENIHRQVCVCEF